METYTYTQHIRTDGKESRWDSKRGISPFDTFFILLAFSPALAFSLWGLGLGTSFSPLCINAPCSPCGSISTFSSFYTFFFLSLNFHLYSLSLSIPPEKGGKRKKQCIRLSFLTFLLLSYTLFASLSNKRITMAFVTATLEEQEDVMQGMRGAGDRCGMYKGKEDSILDGLLGGWPRWYCCCCYDDDR